MIALDLDNCIICYDRPFRLAAEKLGCLPPSDVIPHKASVKAFALAQGGNRLWTSLQGMVYGRGISEATLFPGFREFVRRAEECREPLVIISHKTQYPVQGSAVDLRVAALKWLTGCGLPIGTQLPVYFSDTREKKIARIHAMKCRALVDDLPEIHGEPDFPPQTLFVLFDPQKAVTGWSASPRITSWSEASELLLRS